MKSILDALDIAVTEEQGATWTLTVPAYRSDVTRPADVAEEILRIHGFDHVPLPTRMTGTLEVPAKPNREDVLFGWRELLVSQGFTEIMSNSLTKAKYAELVKDRDLHPEASVHMLNPLSSDLGAMRQSLVFQGLEAVARNSKHKQPDLRLFEFGRTYTQRDVTDEDGTVRKAYDEKEHLSLWVTGRDKPETWNAPKGKDGQADMFTLKHAVESLLAKVGLNVFSEAEVDTDGLLAEGIVLRHANGQEVGRWGLVQPSVAQACEVDVPVFWADFDVAKLWKAVKKAPREGARPGAVPRGASRFGLGGVQVCGVRNPQSGGGKGRAQTAQRRRVVRRLRGQGARRRREELRHGVHLAEPRRHAERQANRFCDVSDLEGP